MEYQVYTIGKIRNYNAKGIYDGKHLTVLAGSKIADTIGKHIHPVARKLRNDPKIVSDEFILRKDITFRSASTAANFVTGNMTNGLLYWKLEDGSPLITIKETK